MNKSIVKLFKGLEVISKTITKYEGGETVFEYRFIGKHNGISATYRILSPDHVEGMRMKKRICQMLDVLDWMWEMAKREDDQCMYRETKIHEYEQWRKKVDETCEEKR